MPEPHTNPTDHNGRAETLGDDELLAEIRAATQMLEGWRLHHNHLTIVAFDRNVPLKDIAAAAGLTKNGIRHRVKLARLEGMAE